jgi:hypothetical protein
MTKAEKNGYVAFELKSRMGTVRDLKSGEKRAAELFSVVFHVQYPFGIARQEWTNGPNCSPVRFTSRDAAASAVTKEFGALPQA